MERNKNISGKKIAIWLWRASDGQHGKIAANCLLGIAGVAFSLIFIWTTKVVIDVATGVREGSIWMSGTAAAAAMLFQLACGAANNWLSNRLSVEAGNNIRRNMFSNLIHSRWNEIGRFHSGDVVNRIEQDTNAIVTLITSSVPAMVISVVQLTAAFVFFCFLDTLLPWLLVLIVPIFIIAGRFYTRKMRKYGREIRSSDSRIQSLIQEGIQHHTVIKTLEQDGTHMEKLDNEQDKLRAQVYDRTRFSLVSRSFVSLAFAGGYLTAFLWGAFRLSAGSITFGTMTAFLQLVNKIQNPALYISQLLPSLIAAVTAAERLMEIENLSKEEEGDSIFFDKTPDLKINDVCFAYSENDEPVFDGLNMEFPSGSRTAVQGETGTGKTTLIRLMLALIEPQQGNITLGDGKNDTGVSSLTRKNFVYVPQGNTLLSGTIRENLLMGDPSADDNELKEALRTAAAEFVLNMPDGVDSEISEKGGGLSEGQAQRISIARALLRPGNIIIMDEATSALDKETESRLIRNLKEKYPQKTFIFITHHMSVAEECERTYTL